MRFGCEVRQWTGTILPLGVSFIEGSPSLVVLQGTHRENRHFGGSLHKRHSFVSKSQRAVSFWLSERWTWPQKHRTCLILDLPRGVGALGSGGNEGTWGLRASRSWGYKNSCGPYRGRTEGQNPSRAEKAKNPFGEPQPFETEPPGPDSFSVSSRQDLESNETASLLAVDG